MQRGLKNSPATFQMAVNVILAFVKWQSAIVYIDNVITFSESPEKYVTHIEEVFRLLKTSGMILNMKKFHSISVSIECLVHVIASSKLQAAITTTKVVEELRYPEDVSQMRSFLGLCNVYRRFMSGFAKISAQLHKKLKKRLPIKFVWDKQARQAVNDLKNRLINPPVLSLLRLKGHYTVDIDANIQVGCVLLQEQEFKANRLLVQIVLQRKTSVRHNTQRVFGSGMVSSLAETVPGKFAFCDPNGPSGTYEDS